MGRFSVRPYVRTYVRPSPPSRAQEPARQALDPASQASEPARQASEPASQASEPASQASEALRPAWLALRPAWLALGPSREGTDGLIDGWTDGKSPHSTALCPLTGPLPRYSTTSTQKLYKAGQGYRRPYDASWRLFICLFAPLFTSLSYLSMTSIMSQSNQRWVYLHL